MESPNWLVGPLRYESDDDIQLVGDALPYRLKLIESLLAESPDHRQPNLGMPVVDFPVLDKRGVSHQGPQQEGPISRRSTSTIR
jgi:hypothetical protein